MRWKTGLGNRLLVANLPTNMLCGLVLLAGDFGVNAESWFAGMRLNVQEIHDPQARVSYRQASEIILAPCRPCRSTAWAWPWARSRTAATSACSAWR